MKLFAHYQRTRTKGYNDYINKQQTQIAKESLEKNNKQINIIPSDNLNIVKKYENSFDDLRVLIVNYNTTARLVTSDDPIIFINNFYPTATGCQCMGLLIFFPVTSNKLAVIYDHKIYTKFRGKQYVNIKNEKDVDLVNTFQFVNALNLVILPTVYSCDFIKQQNKIKKLREKNCLVNKVNVLGPKDNKAIIFNARRTVVDCNLSFASISNKAKKIPCFFRDNLPRNYDKEFEEKLKTEIELMPILKEHKNKRKVQKGELSLFNYNKKQIRLACQDMYKFAKSYWNETD